MIEKLPGLRLTKAAEIVETAVHETLSYYTFPEEHWRRIRTTDEIDKEFFVNQATCGNAAGSFFCSARRGHSSVPAADLAAEAGRICGHRRAWP